MGAIVSFSNWVRENGQWTASERDRLEALTEQFFGRGKAVQMVFGATDDGAPWCAVMNEDDEVLAHIARVDNQVVAHFLKEDILAYGADLREALAAWLSPQSERRGVVVPFARSDNGAELMVLLAVATFLEHQLQFVAAFTAQSGTAAEPPAKPRSSASEVSAEAGANHDAAARLDSSSKINATAHGRAPDAAVISHPATSAQADVATPQAAPSQPSQASEDIAPAQIASAQVPMADAPRAFAALSAILIRGGDGDDVLHGGPRAEWLIGGAGNDTLDGGGGHDVLFGGPGDDRIILTADAVAYGGSGADTFVVSAPTVLGNADTLLGAIFDFNAGEGDRVVATQGDLVILSHPAPPATTVAAVAKFGPEGRMEVDFDGDGHADGYVLLAPLLLPPGAPHPAADEKPMAPATTWSNWPDFVG